MMEQINYSLTSDRRPLLKSGAMSIASGLFLKNSSAQTSPHSDPKIFSGINNRQIGFQLAYEQFPVPELVELGVAAEHAGFDLLANSDHLQPWQANEGHAGLAWVAMSAIGQRTRRIWMGTTVTCPAYRYNPAVVAEAFTSLSLLYPGRIFLGLGSGEALNEEAATGYWPKWNERSERLIEASQIIRKLWEGHDVAFKGKYYSVNARLYDPPKQPIPLFMAANGPKAMRRAGLHADGLITDPKTWKRHKAEFTAGAKEAGKDASKIPVLVEQYVVVGGEKEAREAAEFWRFGPKAWNPYYNIRDPKVIQQRAESEIPLDKVTEGWPVSTEPEAHIKTLNALFESGATEIHIHAGQKDQRQVVEFYGKQVLPKLRSTRSVA
ncbi:MAG TPA: TIGR03557 family F420-dependent LLM class oxidoreductase [Terriglobales bacterium]|jgi:TAT-translocated FGD2 family F420-dependent dehydrogenase